MSARGSREPEGLSKSLLPQGEDCGAPKGRVLFLVGSLSAPRCGDILSPFPSLTASSAGRI
jgi:hypothetical protein